MGKAVRTMIFLSKLGLRGVEPFLPRPPNLNKLPQKGQESYRRSGGGT
jgi:hypothetical protein